MRDLRPACEPFVTLPADPIGVLGRVIAEAPPNDLPALLASLAALMAKIAARQMTTPAPSTDPPSATDENLSVDEASRRLGVSRSWLYKHARQLPFQVRIGRRLLFSAHGLERWTRQRQGR